MLKAVIASAVFDGWALRQGVLLVEDGEIVGLVDDCPKQAEVIRLAGGILMPGMIDLQVNGGGGQMICGQTKERDIQDICEAHARLGTLGLLPTLITDTPTATDQVINAALNSKSASGFLGLHLEGPHLDPRRKGAHDASLIRPMTPIDLERLCHAAQHLPCLMITIAPEAVTAEQIAQLTRAGAIVSLGHSDCRHEVAQKAISAGARCATHLFNAMSQILGREPGLVGTVLTSEIGAGLIADGIHVHPTVMKLALAAKSEGIFLVSDSMAPAGTDLTEFFLGGRRILRKDGRLTLEDGTLAGADLTMAKGIRVLTAQVGLPLARALAMATRIPADLIDRKDIGRLAPGLKADFVLLSDDLHVQGVWRGGERLA